MGSVVTATSMPSSRACASVSPTEATAGTLAHAIQDVCDAYREIEASITTLVAHSGKVRQLQEAASQQIPLSNDLSSQSLETLEKELADLEAAERAAANAKNYAEAQALNSKHDAKTQEVNDYKKFKIQCLDPLRACCTEMGTEFGRLGDRAKRAETLIAAMLNLPRNPHESIDSYMCRRGRAAKHIAKKQGAWSSEWTVKAKSWCAHLQRHPESPAGSVMAWHNQIWLKTQRAKLLAERKPKANTALSMFAGWTGTRTRAGRPCVRFEEGCAEL